MVRFKNRYFLFDLIFAATNSAADTNKQLQWNEKLIAQHLRESIQLLFGDYGYAVCAHSIQVKYFNPYTTLGIVRIARDHADMLSQVLALTTTIKGTPCSMHTLHVSGTIRNSQRRAVEHDRRFIMTIKSEQSSRAQSEAVRLAIEEQQTRLLDESAKRIGNLDV